MKTPYLKIVDAWMLFSLLFHFLEVLLHIIIAYLAEEFNGDSMKWAESFKSTDNSKTKYFFPFRSVIIFKNVLGTKT